MRLLTRSDFDGLICGVLLREAGIVEDWTFVHPKDMQDGTIKVTENDVLANVPYVPGCGLWFDHHTSEQIRHGEDLEFKGDSRPAPSCARVIWDYYGAHKTFAPKFDEMMRYVDKCDSGDLTADEILNPKGWVLLSFIMDPRTGLGRYRDYTISNYQLMMELMEACRTMNIASILELPHVRERTARYLEQDALYRDMLKKRGKTDGNVLVIDLREQEEIYSGNRFLAYTLFPQTNISLQIIWGKLKQNVVFTVGHSILNRTSQTNVGKLMLEYGGGGHEKVGTCQVDHDKAEEALAAILARLKQDG